MQAVRRVLLGTIVGQRGNADRRRLIDDKQHAAMFFELGDERSKLGLVVWQSAVEHALSSEIKRDGVMCSFASVDDNEDLNGAEGEKIFL